MKNLFCLSFIKKNVTDIETVLEITVDDKKVAVNPLDNLKLSNFSSALFLPNFKLERLKLSF